MGDVIEMLEADHREAEALFELIKVTAGELRGGHVDKLAAALRLHMQVEESIVYPAIAKQVDDGADIVKEAKTDHEGARRVLADVEKLSPNEPGFDGALEMLEAGISHHVEEEEDEVFPKLRDSVSAEELDDLGDKVAAAKEKAPV